jgi:hypothetical protein
MGFRVPFLIAKTICQATQSKSFGALEAIVLMHNFCTEYVGYSQIKTVFEPEYVCATNLHGYDQITQYYFHPGNHNSEVDGIGSERSD